VLAAVRTGLSMGYPAWNLLYYTLLCSLPPDPVVAEVGTNLGFSTIVLVPGIINNLPPGRFFR
jgi:hypothetical protein